MEPNALGGGIYPSMTSGMLGVETSSQQQQQNIQNPHHLHNNPQMVSYATHHDLDPHSQISTKHGYPYSTKNKQQTALSDEEEPGGFAADDSSGDPKTKNTSPWQRMKWTDTMVRLLIMAVYYIGDEAVSEGTDPSGKKKPAGLLQKKGKWKSVSRAMMEKGFFVSPQQCEDKFNDLNKRYKRVNDILGKGTACRVVENQNLLETMELSPKTKEEVRKLLNSKHLFFREMCAYHSSCGHGIASGPSTTQPSPEVGTDHQHPHQPATAVAPLRQQCSHSTENGLKGGSVEDDSFFDSESESESEAFSEEDEDESVEGQNGQEQEEEDEMNEGMGRSGRKRKRKAAFGVSSQLMQQLGGEVTGVFQDGGKSTWERKQWMKTRVIQFEEQQVKYQMQAFDLEKRRLKWARFSSKKEREMQRAKLENERRRLETERMLLLIRQKEIELNLHHHQQQQQQHSSN